MKKDFKDYKSILNFLDTEIAIKLLKDRFEEELANKLNLLRVSAPLFVSKDSGLNDNLNGYEKPVSFNAVALDENLEIVQSLAKWKRYALGKYKFNPGYGLYTDMNAIRPYEELDNIHSLYVDQWDWEKVITKEDRTEDYLKSVVRNIYEVLKDVEEVAYKAYPSLGKVLPQEIQFITSEELEKDYPTLSRKERENAIAKKYGAVFLMHIGGNLKDGLPHDGRAADYDDWDLNGDILLWYEPLEMAYEISSMGIRVNKESLLKQLKIKKEEWKLDLPYHKSLINGELPLTIGGGIGQSRLCMFFLKKVHIGEVQVSKWSEEERTRAKDNNIELL